MNNLENQMDNFSQLSPVQPAKFSISFKVIAIIAIFSIFSSITTYFFITSRLNLKSDTRITKKESPLLETNVVSSETIDQTELTTQMNLDWPEVQFSNIFFQHPPSWHVAYLWGLGEGNEIYIGIDPKPIDNGPRGGPIATITIRTSNGLSNPEEKFQEILDRNRASFIDIKEEMVSNKLASAYHFQGNINLYEEKTPSEKYIFMVSPTDINDKQNYQIFVLETVNREDLTDTLKRIFMSMRQI